MGSLSSNVLSMDCPSVTSFQRLSAALFGSPSIRRANGGFKTKFFSKKRSDKISGSDARRVLNLNPFRKDESLSSQRTARPHKCAPSENKIYQLDRQHSAKSEVLPRIWISEVSADAQRDAENPKRDFVAVYPNGEEDKGGCKALELAERMLGEAFSLSEISAEYRVQFFQAAEILLLHAFDRGSIHAALKLGDIYRFDLCRGRYWESDIEKRARHARKLREGDLKRRAWLMYCQAARANLSEAYVALADMEAESGNNADACRAFMKYQKAYHLLIAETSEELSQEQRLAFGVVMLRLAECFEKALGCERSLLVALRLYECSKMNLEKIYDSGCWHSKRDVIEAGRGLARCRQEIHLLRSK